MNNHSAHPRRWMHLTVAALLTCAASAANAQLSPVSSGVVGAIGRARVLADGGDSQKARTLLDSLLSAAPRESNDAAEVLFWRSQLSEDEAQAERDWKRIIVDIPSSPRASEALLRLLELDVSRNNRPLARQRVQQLLTGYPDAPERPKAMLILARTYFDERDAPRACGILTAARREAPLSAVEVRLQADEMQQQCRGVREVAMGAAPDSTTRSAPAPLASITGAVPPLATQTAGLPAGRGGAAGANNAARADSMRRDSIARAAARTPVVNRDSVRRDSIARVTAQRVAAREAADSVRRDSVSRVASQRIADSVRRDSVTKAGLLRAAAQRQAENARRDSISREALRRDSIALDSMGRKTTAPAPAPARSTTTPATRAPAGRINADSARADTLAREAAALEARIMGAVASRDSIKKDSLARVAARRAADAKSGKWTVQIAAYQTKADANALVKRLSARNIDAHIAGTKKPFRVQVGRYATKAEASAALAELKKNGQKSGFVAEVGK